MAFVVIQLAVNLTICTINYNRPVHPHYELNQSQNGPLRPIMYLLLATHFLQFVFLRNFFDEKRRVNTKHSWVWLIHVVVYTYVIYAFLEHHNLPHQEQDPFISRHVWIPMDICLSTFVFMYFVVYWAT